MSNARDDHADSNPLEGRYANYFKIGHNAFEFVLDFAQLFSEGEEPQLHTRIITSPAYAVAMAATLDQSIAEYESKFGAISKKHT
ncbi:MAG: DUF3467 domain-containing protein [Pseudomonadota bacterium]|nr:DUF3467 domain-containing protein [Gammaproteobacteria bacterium]MDQ3582083.1 DUF3467 domain-containing protein [Pseudomonadota bacterium]